MSLPQQQPQPPVLARRWRMRRPWAGIYQRRDSRTIRTRQITIPQRRLGKRVVLVSDIHARDDWFPHTHVADLALAINRVADVDAVLLVGDFVGEDVGAIDWAAAELAAIVAPAYATLGNHDHWTDSERVASQLTAAGVTMLTNTSVEHQPGFWIGGIDSCWGGAPDPERMAHGVPPDAPLVVLGHEPHLATLHDRYLHVAGHTHHGQVNMPVVSPRYYPLYSQPFPKKLYDRGGGRYVYTTAGVGYSVISFRFNCPPEIVVLDV